MRCARRGRQLAGEQAEAFRLAQAGTDLVPDRLTTAMAGLVELGLVTAPGWNRRRVLLAGGVAAAAAVVAVALSSPAAAQSAPGCGGPGGGGPTGATVPGAPDALSALAGPFSGNALTQVNYGALDDGGAPVLSFDLSVNSGGPTSSTTFLPNTVIFLGVVPQGAGDTVRIRAVNSIGAGPYSNSVPVTLVLP